MAGDVLYFIHRHFRLFMAGSMACMLGVVGLTLRALVGA